MSSCTSSNIKSSNTIVNITSGSGNRLIIDIPVANITSPGFSAGDAIFYNVLTSKYQRSRADSPTTSEVLGVVENVDSSGNANVVIYGSIGLTGFIDLSFNNTPGGAGGNDIYFLSGLTAGKLQSLAPTTSGHTIKAVYQTAPHSNYTGVVMNYVGYRIS